MVTTAGVVAVIDVDEFTVRFVAGSTMVEFAVSTKLTVVLFPEELPRNPVPVIVMDVPPAADPWVPPLAVAMLETVGITGW